MQRRGVSVRTEIDSRIWIDATRSQVFSILWNLVHNAVSVMERGGEVRVTARLQDRKALLEVEDDGPGMTAVARARAFEPYFTTRAEGTGLGLSIVQRIVRELGGEIALRSAPGAGTCFSLELPAPVERSDISQIRSQRLSQYAAGLGEGPEGAPRVLLVEDDQSLRELLATTLSLCGITSVPADGFASALEATAAAGPRGPDAPFDAAVIDLTLGDGRGDRLLGRLRGEGRVRHALLISGGIPPDDLDPKARPDQWIRKPFEPMELLAAVRALLERRHEGARASAPRAASS